MTWWKMWLTRLAVGLIFFVSTFFSDVNLLTEACAIFNLKQKWEGEMEREEEQEKVRLSWAGILLRLNAMVSGYCFSQLVVP